MKVSSVNVGFSKERLARIEEHLTRTYIEPGKIAGCQVAVSRHGELAYFLSLGMMDIEGSAPMPDDAIFRIHSMTKPITSVALMILYERGYFQLDDPVSRFIPDWKKQRVWVSGEGENMVTAAPIRPVTIRDMLCHTGGLTYGLGLLELKLPHDRHPVTREYERLEIETAKKQSLQALVNKLAFVPLRYQPGEQWMYSLSTDVCAALVEIISGKTFEQFLNDELFSPLGMKDTSFHISKENTSRLAANYRRDLKNSLHLIDDPKHSTYQSRPTFFSGGGGLLSTTYDYLQFCEMLRRGGAYQNHRILSAHTVALMRQNHLQDGKDLASMAIGLFSETKYQGIGFGLGFAMTIDPIKSASLVATDWYWGGAASTIFWVDEFEDLCVVFMTQLMPSTSYDFRGELKTLVYSAITD